MSLRTCGVRALFRILSATLLFNASCALANGSLGIDQRVACQATLEDIAWSENIWPEANTSPKPARKEMLSDAAIHARVEDQLRMEDALSGIYGQVIDDAALQIELNRMAVSTRAPDRLRQRFDALGNDARTIAECMARPNLVQKRLREAYAWDAGEHGALREAAEAVLQYLDNAAALQASGAQDETLTLALRLEGLDASPAQAEASFHEPLAIELDPEDFAAESARLTPASVLPGDSTMSQVGPRLRETDSGFVYEEVLARADNRIDLRRVSWPKQSFDAWWNAQRGKWALPQAKATTRLELPKIHGKAMDLSKAAANSWRVESTLDERYQHTAVWTGSEMIVWGGTGVSNFNTGARYNPTSNTWAGTSISGAPAARYRHTAAWTGSEMIVWGGYGGGSFLNTGGRYNAISDTWVATASNGAPTARASHTAVWSGSEMFVWGGYGGAYLNTGGRYNPTSDTWVATAISGAPAARFQHTSIWTENEMIVWGGDNGSSLNSGGRYNPVSDTWVATASSGAPIARYAHTAIWTGSEMIVWGGYNGSSYPATGGRYNPANDSWVVTANSGAPTGRFNHAVVWTGSEMIVWGGAGVSVLNTGGRYNPVSDTWVATETSSAPSARTLPTAVWTGSEMIVWGGFGGGYLNTGGRYNPVSDSWAATATSGAPVARSSHSAVWTGSEMIVWGGSSGSALNTGGRYNPVSDTWVATASSGAPVARSSHSAVWTGSEMIVWGGYVGSALNSGGRYNPANDSWVATASSGAPIARYAHTAIWTGGEMIVWGGYGGSALNSGGRYNPVNDSWVVTASSGAPTARNGHTAVWTGSEMIVWGGSSGPALNTGGRYSPVSDTWVATASSGAPAARSSHSAVWTGSEMIVWGGNGASYFNSGGRYNPVSETWIATSISGAPTMRNRQTAVWTGSEMIVWGGYLDTNTGGRYNPANDSWVATATSGAPAPRYSHTAVWTGSEMIVWGGYGGSYFASMGVYYPAATHLVTANSIGNGSITPLSQDVNHGGTANFTLTPDTGYHVVSVAGDTCTVTGSGSSYSAANIQADCAVVATFAINTYTLTYTAGANGSITGTSPQTVDHGSSGTAVTAVADTGYHFTQWSDGSTANPRTDANVTANISVTAEFAINQYTLTYTAGANGTITGTSPQTVDHGSSGSAVTAVADTGYHFTQWSDGSTANPRTDANVTADLNVTAEFAINQYTLTYTAGANGSITGTSPQTVDHGASGSAVTAVADTGYHFTQWSDGSTANPRTDANVTADLNVTAEFAINVYSVTASSGGNGSITPPSQDVNHGDSANFTVAPGSGYHVENVTGDTCTVTGSGSSYSAANITSDCAVTATFAIDPPDLALSVTDNRDYARYGQTLVYIVTLSNQGLNTVSAIDLSMTLPVAIDEAATTWQCLGAGAGAVCQASGTGELNDSTIVLPSGRTLNWIVNAPVLAGSLAEEVTTFVQAEAGVVTVDASDSTTLVIFRNSFELNGDGAEGTGAVVDSFAQCTRLATHELSEGGRLQTFSLLPAWAGQILAPHTVWTANAGNVRLERIELEETWLRLVLHEPGSTDQASEWVRADAEEPLGVGLIDVSPSQNAVVLEGAESTLLLWLPQGRSSLEIDAGACD